VRKTFSRLRRRPSTSAASGFDSALGLDQRFGERVAAAALADEVEKVGHPPLLGQQLGLLQLQGFWQVGATVRDLLLDGTFAERWRGLLAIPTNRASISACGVNA
jgi:hypothetical protein